MTDAIPAPSAATQAAAQAIIAVGHLADVRSTRITAEILQEGSRAIDSITFLPTLEFSAETGLFSNRYTYHFDLNNIDGETVAQVEFALVLDWTIPADFTPEQSGAEFIARTTGYFAAFPYARELFHNLTTRLSIDPIVLGALRRETLTPTSVTIALRPLGLTETDTPSAAELLP